METAIQPSTWPIVFMLCMMYAMPMTHMEWVCLSGCCTRVSFLRNRCSDLAFQDERAHGAQSPDNQTCRECVGHVIIGVITTWWTWARRDPRGKLRIPLTIGQPLQITWETYATCRSVLKVQHQCRHHT